MILTSNLRLLDAPGNVLITAGASGLPKDSVANVSQVFTLDRTVLSRRAGRVAGPALKEISRGLRLVLDL